MPHDHKTIYIVDDDYAIRDSMVEMLDAAGLPAEAYSSASAFLAAFDPERTGCLVLDIFMPGMDGLDLCERIRREHADIPIIIVTGHGDVPRTRRSFKMGAVDLIEKPFSNKQLLALIRKAIEEAGTARHRNKRRAQIKTRITLLSERERQVMDFVTVGALNKQMAADLGVHERTIEFHRKNIMRKMKADSVPELVEMVVQSRTEDALG